MCLPGTLLPPSLSFYFFSWVCLSACLSVFPISINIFLNWFSWMKHVHGLLQWLVACVLVSSTRTHWCVGVTFKLSLPVSSEQRVLIVSPGSVSIADWPSVCKEPLSPLLEKPPSHPSHTAAWESRHSMRFTQDTSPSKGPWASSFVSYVRNSLRNHALLSNIRPQTLLIFTQTNIAVSKHPLWIVTTSSMQLSSVVWCTGNIKKIAFHIHNNEKGHMAVCNSRTRVKIWMKEQRKWDKQSVTPGRNIVCRVQEGMLRGFLFHVGAIPKQLKAVLGYQVCRRSQRCIWQNYRMPINRH